MLTQLPPEFGNLWHVREDLFYARVPTKLWTEILLLELDRPLVHGRIVQLVGKRVGPGVYEIRVAKDPAK